ncbi:MAG TPA: guanine deaminase [Massilia sp.]|nr:guanine deaminase [Massilia sp.]
MSTHAIRGDVVTFRGDPFLQDPQQCLVYERDALVVLADGKIADIGPADQLGPRLPAGTEVAHYKDAIISAGFIDTHIHYPQTQMVAAFGEHLLEWLNKYTFVVEQQFAGEEHSRHIARVFLRELLRCGTTTAAIYCTVHPQSVDALFEESTRFNTRMVAGKVMMNRNAPEALLDTTERGYRESSELIQRWHGKGRQVYCITPRFAPTSTEDQLAACGALYRENPGTYVQTHLCENKDEIAWVLSLFPERKSYLDVYAHAGIVGPRSIYGHGIHLTEDDFATCHQTGAALAHCPTSNFFLGSGLFRLFDAKKAARPVRVGLGTDIGAGTSFSQLQTLNEAYKVAEMNDTKITSIQAFYLATRGSAEALYFDDRIGTVAPGYEADLVVLDPRSTPLLAMRSEYCSDIAEQLFVLMMLGDDRAVRATYVAGEMVYDRDAQGDKFRYPGQA